MAANAAVDSARAALQAANDFLAAAPKGKNTKAELEAMGQELAALQTSLDEAMAGIAGEDYINAKIKADVVTQQAKRSRPTSRPRSRRSAASGNRWPRYRRHLRNQRTARPRSLQKGMSRA